MTDIIATKRDGRPLSDDAIRWFVRNYTAGDVPDYQASALLMAIYLRGLSGPELSVWTDAMLHSGRVLDLSAIAGFKVDKHSTGGVGDKVSLILAPLVAATGLAVPMIAGRALGHTGGTLDKLESIPGFVTGLPVDHFVRQLQELGCCIIGQTPEIAPADRKFYALRDVTSTVDCIPLIASSIMSKKLAAGIDGLVLDIKVGSGAFMRSIEQATELALTMIDIGERAGRRVVVMLTDMNQPLGSHIGNSLEVIESCDVLRGKKGRLRDLTVQLSAAMLHMATGEDLDSASHRLETLLDDGRAFARFEQMVTAQGGDARALSDYALLPTAPCTTAVTAVADGYLSSTDCLAIGEASMRLGAGRLTKEDAVDPAAGIVMHHEVGDPIRAGETLATLHHRIDLDVAPIAATLQSAMTIAPTAPVPTPLVLRQLDVRDLRG
jgi:pyrimidine-nucleoside phosphorylase